MRHARRIWAATLASSVSLLTTFGLAEAIRASDQGSSGATAAKSVTAGVPTGGPSRIVVIRRSRPSDTIVQGRTVYVQAPSSSTVSVPAAPTTRSS